MKVRGFKHILRVVWREGATRLFLFTLALWAASVLIARFRYYHYVRNGDLESGVPVALLVMGNLLLLLGIISLILALVSLMGVDLPFLAKWLRTQKSPEEAKD